MSDLLIYREIRKIKKILKKELGRIRMAEQDLRDAVALLSSTIADALTELANRSQEPDVTPAESSEIANQIKALATQLRNGLSPGQPVPNPNPEA